MLPELKKDYNVSYIGIFGSYVRGEHTPESDLDLLVEFSKTPTI
ncbi:nucleotidyltransferase family protein, partial [Methanomethylovorans sp.]